MAPPIANARGPMDGSECPYNSGGRGTETIRTASTKFAPRNTSPARMKNRASGRVQVCFHTAREDRCGPNSGFADNTGTVWLAPVVRSVGKGPESPCSRFRPRLAFPPGFPSSDLRRPRPAPSSIVIDSIGTVRRRRRLIGRFVFVVLYSGAPPLSPKQFDRRGVDETEFRSKRQEKL
jgi:hypothetical protein